MATDLNPTKLHQPVITITHKPGGAGYPTPIIVDLAHQESQPQERVIETTLDTMAGFAPLHSSRAA